MRVGLVDVDSHRFPNLPLMKISAWHKAQGDTVEFASPLEHYDIAYVSKIFGSEYSPDYGFRLDADRIITGGTGYAIAVENGREVFHRDRHSVLPYEIEHIYPDYLLYPELTRDRAYGFLTRGCPNGCPWCIVSQSEGRKTVKVADVSEWWNGQRNICLMDANILACPDRLALLDQLAATRARVNFCQGLDARQISDEVCEHLAPVRREKVHFAYDRMDAGAKIEKGLELARDKLGLTKDRTSVYILTNYDTTLEEDLYRIAKVEEIGLHPDVRIYRKESLPRRHILRDLQRWCNNRFIHALTNFENYAPRGKTMKEEYNI